MRAFDILTGDQVAISAGDRPRTPAGWAGRDGPAIDVRTWPRSPRTGQPMLHCFTLRLPEEYRRRGPGRVAVSVFQWDDELYFAPPLPEVAAAPDHAPRAHQRIADDGVAALFALRWLDRSEYDGPRLPRPAEVRELAEGEDGDTDPDRRWGWYGPLWLLPREDPNAGVAPVPFPRGADTYVRVPERYQIFHTEHLGGTSMDPNVLRRGLSPWYLEVHRLGGLSHGGDHLLALDLDAPSFLGDTDAGP